jgi:hypothetical protein
MEGFAIGPTTNPCTKGIWIWSKPVRLNETTDMIILDTEGLNSVCKYLYILYCFSDSLSFFVRARLNNRHEDLFNISSTFQHVYLQ